MVFWQTEKITTSHEKSAVVLAVPLYVICLFSLAFKIFPLPLVFNKLIIQAVPLYVICLFSLAFKIFPLPLVFNKYGN